MGTFSQTNIKCDRIETVLTELKKHLNIGRSVWSDKSDTFFHRVQHENNPSTQWNTTITITKNQSTDWVEIEFDFNGNLYVYDEVLRRISGSLETTILLGYFQSTTGDGRLAKFKDGRMDISFFERHFYYKSHDDDRYSVDRLYVADNFGVQNSKLPTLKETVLGVDSSLIDHDFIYEFYRSEGWDSDLHINYHDWKYLHVEQKHQ